jgi:hypothetical protein
MVLLNFEAYSSPRYVFISKVVDKKVKAKSIYFVFMYLI